MKRIALASIVLLGALAGAAMTALAGPAYRVNLVDLHGAITLIRFGAWVGLGAAILALPAAWLARRKPSWLIVALVAMAIGAMAFGIPLAMLENAKRAPPIHDISTDTANPPRFVAVVPLRANAPNSPVYAGNATASKQQSAYPDIRPLVLPVPANEAFSRALDAARAMGWTIAASVPAEGRIEATDTTAWFGFKDDIVVRVEPTTGGSRVDVRSESRIGVSDLGKNAKRVREYLGKVAG